MRACSLILLGHVIPLFGAILRRNVVLRDNCSSWDTPARRDALQGYQPTGSLDPDVNDL